MSNNYGYIYILTNPSFKEYVKIGYADNVEERVTQLNRTECTPFAFRIYATYKVDGRLKDKPVHELIDKFRPDLRSIDKIDGKLRVREFYAMSPEQALEILTLIAKTNSLEENICVYSITKEERDDEKIANKIEKDNINRHHFKNIEFSSSLTGKSYLGRTNDRGTLSIVDKDTNEEVASNSNPSKKSIVGQAILDLGGSTSPDETLYQRYRKLTKLVSSFGNAYDRGNDLSNNQSPLASSFERTSIESEEFIIRINKQEAIMEVRNGLFIVKAGSIIRINLNSNNPSKEIHERDLASGLIIKSDIPNIGHLKEDKIFKSSSGASKYVYGNSCNGKITWKTRQGTLLAEFL